MVLKITSPVWLFDLDNTLHNASPHIFPHLNSRDGHLHP
jgi:putative hydrolase of the HAD superfamily